MAKTPFSAVRGVSNAVHHAGLLRRGGYEILCFLYSGAYTLVNNADQVLLDENLRILRDKK